MQRVVVAGDAGDGRWRRWRPRRRLSRVVVGQVDQRGERGLEGVRDTARPSFSKRSYSARSASLSVTSGARSAPPSRRMPPSSGIGGQVGARRLHVHVAPPDARVDRARLEQPHQVLEVADRAGAEVPAVVVGKASAVVAAGVVAQARLRRERRAGRVQPEPGQPAGLEARDQEGVVGRVRLELARAEQARVGQVAVRRERRRRSCGSTAAMSVESTRRRWRQAAVDVHVRPGPQLVGGRERLRRVGDLDERQRPVRARCAPSANSPSSSTTSASHGRSRCRPADGPAGV